PAFRCFSLHDALPISPDVRSDIAPNALSVLNSVFGLPGFRGAQEEIVRHVTDGGNCLMLMPTGAGIEAILQHAHWLGAVIDVSKDRKSTRLNSSHQIT